jgi:EAL domain-containing protein (putative c-di-GMP-specific phosphodiesterase class I)
MLGLRSQAVEATAGARMPIIRHRGAPAPSLHDQATVAMVRDALRTGRVALAVQPVVYAADPARTAFHEGLIRLRDHAGHLIPARAFIGAVEGTDLGRQIDRAALALGLAMLRDEPGLRLALNISARSLGAGRWMETLARGLARDETVAERLILEITEGSALAAPEVTATCIHALQRQGISFALDDFGAGQTAFRYFRAFSFDIVKIDRQFIAGVHRDRDNQVLVQALAMIARQFDMLVVAEGVERAEDAAWLNRQGIDCLQGYLFGLPETRPRTGTQALRRA